MNTIKMIPIIVLLLLTTSAYSDGNATPINPEDAPVLRYAEDGNKVFKDQTPIKEGGPTLREIYENDVSQRPDWNKPMYLSEPQTQEGDVLALMRTEDGKKIFSGCILTNKIQQYDWYEATYLCEPVKKPFFLPTLSWWQAILGSGLIGICTILGMKRKKVVAKTED